MRASIVRIGNSQGLRIPKAILEACGIRDEVDLTLDQGRLIVSPLHRRREGWAEAAEGMHAAGEDVLLDEDTGTDFDQTSWEW